MRVTMKCCVILCGWLALASFAGCDSGHVAEVDAGSNVDGAVGADSAADGSVAVDAEVGADADTDASTVSCTLGGLRSALYPDNWTPGFADSTNPDRFLQDYSYAGYHNGEQPLPTGDFAQVYDVTAPPYGADNSGGNNATAAIQAAIDDASANGGGIVHLPAGTYNVATRLVVRASGVVLRGEGSQGAQATRIHFIDGGSKPNVQLEGELTNGVRHDLTADAEIFDTHVTLADVSGLNPGDYIHLNQTITTAFITEHDMMNYWAAVHENAVRTIFRRRITSVDASANRVHFKVPIRYPLKTRDSPFLRQVSGVIQECGVEHLALSNATDAMEDAWNASNTWAILEIENTTNCWVRDVRSYASPENPDYHLRSMGLRVRFSSQVTVDDVHLSRAQNTGGGGNGYPFSLASTNDVLVKDCSGSRGRHIFSIGWPFGGAGNVFLRVQTSDPIGFADWDHYTESLLPTSDPDYRPPWTDILCSDLHMQLSVANLIDNSQLDACWQIMNRGLWSAGAGHTGTQNVLWNNHGTSQIISYQFGWGYVIGTQGLTVRTQAGDAPNSAGTTGADQGTEPYDYTEHIDAQLSVSSLYEDQLARRLGHCQ